MDWPCYPMGIMTAILHDEYLADALDETPARMSRKVEIARQVSEGLTECRCGLVLKPGQTHRCAAAA